MLTPVPSEQVRTREGRSPHNSKELTAEEVVERLNGAIDNVLRPLLPRGSSCALLDFPAHSNLGDSAIWLGEKVWLRRNDVKVVYTCSLRTYAPEQLTRKLGRTGVILIHGGGNFGDLYPWYQQFREQVVQDFPHYRIVQMPQTVYFKGIENLKRSKRIFRQHPNFALLVRGRRSFEFVRNEFQVSSFLCPDMAFTLGQLNRTNPARQDILWLLRSDRESIAQTDQEVAGQGIKSIDWTDEPRTILADLEHFLTTQMRLHPRRLRGLSRYIPTTYDQLAKRRLARGCQLLSQGRVVVTNRLHAHILCILLKIPHVLLDNSYGKVRRFYDTWTEHCPLTYWADSLTDATAFANKLVYESAVRHRG